MIDTILGSGMMSKAAEILQRIVDNNNNGLANNFDSEYTKARSEDNLISIMHVDSERLFNDLTPDEKIHFSYKDEKNHDWPYLCIWDRGWIYVPPFDNWYLVQIDNLWDSRNNVEIDYKLVLWEGCDYLIDVDNCRLFKEVRTNEVQSNRESGNSDLC